MYGWGCPLLVAGAAGTAVSAKESQEEQHGAMTYVGTVLADVVYVPAKVVFTAAGALTSGVAYIVTVGDSNASSAIWNKSVNGDYVLTPSMVEGKKPVHFVGS